MKKLVLSILLTMLLSSMVNAQALFPLKDPATGKMGLTDKNGNFIVNGEYDQIALFSDHIYTVVKDGLKGLIDAKDLQWKLIKPITLAYLGDPDPNGIVIYNNGGVLNEKTGVVKGGKWGFINLKGENIGKEYSAVLPFYFHGENLAAVCEGGKVEEILPPYIVNPSAIKLSSDKTFLWQALCTTNSADFDIHAMTKASMSSSFVSKGKWGFIDASGKEVIPCAFDNIGDYFFENRLVVEIGNKYGYIDKTGKTILPPQYKYAGNFYGGKAAVMNKDKWGYINYEGTEIVPQKYYTAMPFINDVALVGTLTKAPSYLSPKVISYGYIRTDGTEIIPQKHERADIEFTEGVARVYSEGDGWFLLDAYGQKLSAEKYSMIGSLKNRYIIVGKEGKTFYYNKDENKFEIEKGDSVSIPAYMGKQKEGVDYNLFYEKDTEPYHWVDCSTFAFPILTTKKQIVKFDGYNIHVAGKFSLIDHKGKVISKNLYDFIDNPYGGRSLAITTTGQYCWIDTLGQETLLNYTKVGRVFENMAYVSDGTKYGIINDKGKVIIPPKYESMATRVYDGLLPVKINDKWGCINVKDELVIPAMYNNVADIGEVIKQLYIPKGRVTPTQRELQLFLFTLQGEHNKYSIDDIIPDNMWSY